MLSVLLPAFREEKYLNRTIDNLFTTCSSDKDLEVIVVDQGGNGEIDKRARVITPGENVGERRAMNLAAESANGEWLMRIDAHCDFSPQNWDIMLTAVTGEKDITVAVLTSTDKNWNRESGHWYGLCRLIKTTDENGRIGLEAKWQTPNQNHEYPTLVPNMALTGCGFVIRKAFYEDIGGADETLPKMGAIGEEFAIKAWAHGGKVQTRTDVMVGHIFSTGGYDTSGVAVAQQMLWDKWGSHYDAVADKFPNFEGVKTRPTHQLHIHTDLRTVTSRWEEVTETKDEAGKVVERRIRRFVHFWHEEDHPDEVEWIAMLHSGDDEKVRQAESEIMAKYMKFRVKVGGETLILDDAGQWIKAA